jgi:hypothetical protein
MTSSNTHIYKAKYAQYYENINGGSPKSIRLVRVEGDQLVGMCLGREYTVAAQDYKEVTRRNF